MNDRYRNDSSWSAMLVGILLGAAGLALMDKDMRRRVVDKIRATADDLKEEGSQRMDAWKQKVDEGKEKAKSEIREIEDKIV